LWSAHMKSCMTTKFWCGESSDSSNAFIPNVSSYWLDDWVSSFGGIDDPRRRNGYHPAKFTPKENPFYFALPYGEFVDGDPDHLKPSASNVPWYRHGLQPLLKNLWLKVDHGGRSVFCQWADVGPNGEDDFAWVFGDASAPRNTFGLKAGLDLSPACWTVLGVAENVITSWCFVKADEVLDGPWREIITGT
jgi:hypothetical protein